MANIRIVSVGKVKEPHWQAAAAHYRGRLAQYWALQETEVKDGNPRLSDADRSAEEGDRILTALRETDTPIILDERGKTMTSPEFARWLDDLTLDRNRTPCLLIGGPFGLSRGVKQQAAHRLSLGKMTLPHELARVVLLEQLYRAGAILAGSPYHHE